MKYPSDWHFKRSSPECPSHSSVNIQYIGCIFCYLSGEYWDHTYSRQDATSHQSGLPKECSFGDTSHPKAGQCHCKCSLEERVGSLNRVKKSELLYIDWATLYFRRSCRDMALPRKDLFTTNKGTRLLPVATNVNQCGFIAHFFCFSDELLTLLTKPNLLSMKNNL